LIDTSVWSLAFRRRAGGLSSKERAMVTELERLILHGQAQLMGPIRQELLSGIRDHKQFERLRERLQPFLDVPLTTDDHERAAAMFNRCMSAGVAGSDIDFLICAVAERLSAPIFTTDEDFFRYSKHLGINLYSA
jgi:predicted nucleic acid-binding protein